MAGYRPRLSSRSPSPTCCRCVVDQLGLNAQGSARQLKKHQVKPKQLRSSWYPQRRCYRRLPARSARRAPTSKTEVACRTLFQPAHSGLDMVKIVVTRDVGPEATAVLEQSAHEVPERH